MGVGVCLEDSSVQDRNHWRAVMYLFFQEVSENRWKSRSCFHLLIHKYLITWCNGVLTHGVCKVPLHELSWLTRHCQHASQWRFLTQYVTWTFLKITDQISWRNQELRGCNQITTSGRYIFKNCRCTCQASVAESVERLATGWMGLRSNSGVGEVFRTRQTGPGVNTASYKMSTESLSRG